MIDNKSVSQEALLVAKRVTKDFSSPKGEVEVLDGVSFDVQRGTLTAILGPSGCGKTTLMKILAGILIPDDGHISTNASNADLRDQIAYMPQSDSLLPWRTALDNAMLSSQIGGLDRSEARTEAQSLLSRFGLRGFEKAYPSELSGGMKQRLTLIRTFLAHREILLLDEPLGSLDALTRTDMQEWLLGVWEQLGKTVLLVTHDVEEAAVLSDKLILLSHRPASVRQEYRIDLPRPRDRTDNALVDLRANILDLIHREAHNEQTG